MRMHRGGGVRLQEARGVAEEREAVGGDSVQADVVCLHNTCCCVAVAGCDALELELDTSQLSSLRLHIDGRPTGCA